MKHTDTPWAWHWRNDKDVPGSVHATQPEGRAPAVAMCPRYGKESFKHDAPRIVACVNAFHGTGIPTNQIDEGMLLRIAEMLDQCRAAVWDSHYGNGITAGYARKATEGVSDMVRKLMP